MIEALKRGAISEAADSPRQAMKGVSFVVLAAPPAATLDLLDQARGWLADGALLSDVTSIKVPVMQRALKAGLEGRFAGAHPLTGTHTTGFDAARPDLFRGAVVYVCSTGTVEGDAVARSVASFWERVGEAQAIRIEAAAHDAQLRLDQSPPAGRGLHPRGRLARAGDGRRLVRSGGRDTTRLAASDPDLWTEIFLSNGDAVLEALDGVGQNLARLRQLVAARDAIGVRAFLAEGAAFRKGLD